MKRANIKMLGAKNDLPMHYHDMILIENMEDLYEYQETIHTERLKEAMKDIIHSSKRHFLGHCNTVLDRTRVTFQSPANGGI